MGGVVVRNQSAFPVKSQIVNTLGFADHMASY